MTGQVLERVQYEAPCPGGCGADVVWTSERLSTSAWTMADASATRPGACPCPGSAPRATPVGAYGDAA